MLEHLKKITISAARDLNARVWAKTAGELSFEVTKAVHPRFAAKNAPTQYLVRIHSKKPINAGKVAIVVKMLASQAKKRGKGCETLEFAAPKSGTRLWASNLNASEATAFFRRNPELKKMLSYSKPFAWVLTATRR